MTGGNKERFAQSTVIGAAIKNLGEILRPYLTNRDPLLTAIDEMQGDEASGQYYPVQLLVDLLGVAKRQGILSKIAENRAIGTLRILMGQPGIQTPMDVLQFLSGTIGNHHRGEVGELEVSALGPKSAQVVDTTYLPCGFTIPMLVKTLVGFGAKNVTYTHEEADCREHGAPGCKITFAWDESDLLRIRQV